MALDLNIIVGVCKFHKKKENQWQSVSKYETEKKMLFIMLCISSHVNKCK